MEAALSAGLRVVYVFFFFFTIINDQHDQSLYLEHRGTCKGSAKPNMMLLHPVNFHAL